MVVHVGPHKTGTTSIQNALYENKNKLKSDGIIYPRSIPGSVFFSQHSDLAFAVMSGNFSVINEYLSYLANMTDGQELVTVVLSGEEFSRFASGGKTVNYFIDAINERWNVTYVYVKRDKKDLIVSSLMQFLMGEVGEFYLNNYDIDKHVKKMLDYFSKVESYFANLNTIFLDYDEIKGENIAKLLIQRAVGASFDYLTASYVNTLNSKIDNNQLILTYPLRVMLGVLNNESNLSSRCVSEAMAIIKKDACYDDRLKRLIRAFKEHLSDVVERNLIV